MFQTTRRRLAIWYTAVTAILFLLFATGVYLYVRSTLIERMDDTLKHVVEVVERSLSIQTLPQSKGGSRVNIEESFRNNAEAVEDDRIDLEWFSPNGKLLWSTFSGALDIPIQLYPKSQTVREVRLLPGGNRYDSRRCLRQVTKRIEKGREVLGYLRVSHPWFEVTKPIRQLILDLTIGALVTIACVAGIGWFLSGLAIEPVRQSYQSLKQFTADASHELRNPIATIQTNVQMMLAYPDADPQFQRRQLEVIERLTRRLGRLVNDLLFLARSDSGMLQVEFQRLPLDALLIEAIEEQRAIAENAKIYLSLRAIAPTDDSDLGEDVFAVDGDWDCLARLFTNLISNALEYAQPQSPEESEKGAVAVELQRIKRDRHPILQVRIEDTGRGIPESDLPHIFDRFYRVDPARSRTSNSPVSTGTGLGLAIARAIANNHRGQIGVESVRDRGTVFTVRLPAAKLE
ncbi:sensor histidine kinase [Lusitaniella coriacea]|uniref:sensor histidine kinase n=1 Tax=Lusitaniella coriacea TaxID=1983105 RepID=UPI003CFB3929